VLGRGQFIYLDTHAILSNAWSGRLYIEHELTNPTTFAANDSLEFLVTNGHAVHFIEHDEVKWKGTIPEGQVIQVINHPTDDILFYLLATDAIYSFST